MWQDLDQSRPPDVFEFNRVVFGLNSSLFLAQFVTQQHAEKFASVYPRAATTIQKSTYMDDCMDSVDTEHEGIELFNDLCAIWKSAGMHAKKWVTNSKVIFDLIPKDDKVVVFDVLAENASAVKTLGLWWRAEGDTFEFKSPLSVVEKITKRIWLSKISTLFDPLGFITPFTIRARILVQQIWVKGYTWDEVVDNEIKCACLAWLKELSQLPEIKVSRWLYMSNDADTTKFHIFVDASGLAYGAVCYVKTASNSGKIAICLVCSKTKVAPLKAVTIPRLELMAATLGVQLGQTVSKALNFSMNSFNFWTDSMNVLWWIRGCSRSFKAFVANRVGKIQSCTNPEQWRHVKSNENPVDLLSRGCGVSFLSSNRMWWQNPKFTQLNNAEWPSTAINKLKFETEKKRQISLITNHRKIVSTKVNNEMTLGRLAPERFSD